MYNTHFGWGLYIRYFKAIPLHQWATPVRGRQKLKPCTPNVLINSTLQRGGWELTKGYSTPKLKFVVLMFILICLIWQKSIICFTDRGNCYNLQLCFKLLFPLCNGVNIWILYICFISYTFIISVILCLFIIHIPLNNSLLHITY